MLVLGVLAACAAVVLGQSSPNADLVDGLNQPPGRYPDDVIEDAKLDVSGLVAKYGYPIERHFVMTEDGYILTMHRIPHGRDQNNQPDPNKTVVFLMHGLVSSSADFLVLGPENALGYMLAEEGYDVWLGNARGNFYSRRHRRLSPDSLNQDFWRFSWDEIGNLDLPAFLDYIEGITGKSKLHYIGHSQGGTSFLVLNSLRPSYNKKFISFQGLAPASFFTNNGNSIITTLASFESILESAGFAKKQGEIFRSSNFMTWLRNKFCRASKFEPMCGGSSLTTSDYVNQTMVPVFSGHAPAGASLRQFAHFGQNIRFNSFRRFNYNALTNLAIYGSRTPPDYNLSLITVPTYIHYSLNDALVHPKDVEILAASIQNIKSMNLVNSTNFGHVDFIWGKTVKYLVYRDLLRMMKEAEINFT